MEWISRLRSSKSASTIPNIVVAKPRIVVTKPNIAIACRGGAEKEIKKSKWHIPSAGGVLREVDRARTPELKCAYDHGALILSITVGRNILAEGIYIHVTVRDITCSHVMIR